MVSKGAYDSHLCEKENETIAHFTLNWPQWKDATTAAHDNVRRRLSKTLEKALEHSSDRWVLRWEKQGGLAFPGLAGTQGTHNWDALTKIWVNL